MQVVKKTKVCRVLIVEDHADTLSVVTRLLSRHGYQTSTAMTIAEARAACAVELPDVVLADLQLPDGSGLDLVRELRERGDVRFIALSGHGQRQHIEATRTAGFDAHLVKPVSFEQLDSALRAVCNGTDN